MPEKVHHWLDTGPEPDGAESRENTANINGNSPKEVGESKKRKRDGTSSVTQLKVNSERGDNSSPKFLEKESNPVSPKPKSVSQLGKTLSPVSPKISPSKVGLPQTQAKASWRQGKKGKAEASPLQDRAKALWPVRKALPIWSHSIGIRNSLRNKDVLLLVGETGSGKSTQVPQILLGEPWCKAGGGRIAVTEPRRVAAISLARRVAEEMGSPLGSSSPASAVGYSVRFDNSTGPNTKIKFLTEGMLLQEILRDPFLNEYSAVIVDEVHERGINVDLVLGFLRRLLGRQGKGRRGGRRLKVCVMSATADMEQLSRFFADANEVDEEAPVNRLTENGSKNDLDSKDDAIGKIITNGDAVPSRELDFEKPQSNAERTAEAESDESSEWSGFSASDDEITKEATPKPKPRPSPPSERSIKISEKSPTKDNKPVNGTGTNGIILKSSDKILDHKPSNPQVDICHIEGRQFPVKINYVPEPVQDIVEASLKTIFQIHYKEPLPGDILVFLTGQEAIESLENLVKEYALGMSTELPKLLVFPLFAALPQAAQQQVFESTPSRTRKVIISTNIAETSVTVPGVRFVIDCGKAKVKHFRTRIGLESLLVKPISKSAAIQRKGRAGREAPGQCYRLYTEKDYLALDESNTPEILRCDLSHPILTIRARGVEDVLNFPFLNQPPREAMEKALLQLWMLGALEDTGAISNIGRQIARLPLTVSLGRALIAAAEPDSHCVNELIDIIACLSVENVFFNLNSEEKRDQAEAARRELYRREGDHLTLLATVQGYAAEGSDRKVWADRHYVSHRAMRAVVDVRKQLRVQCQQMGFLTSRSASSDEGPPSTLAVSSDLNTAILKAFLKGFAMNTAALCPDGSYKTFVGKQTVAIHPSSVLFGRKVEAIMFNEFVFTKKSYARGVSAVQLDWIAERFPGE